VFFFRVQISLHFFTTNFWWINFVRNIYNVISVVKFKTVHESTFVYFMCSRLLCCFCFSMIFSFFLQIFLCCHSINKDEYTCSRGMHDDTRGTNQKTETQRRKQIVNNGHVSSRDSKRTNNDISRVFTSTSWFDLWMYGDELGAICRWLLTARGAVKLWYREVSA